MKAQKCSFIYWPCKLRLWQLVTGVSNTPSAGGNNMQDMLNVMRHFPGKGCYNISPVLLPVILRLLINTSLAAPGTLAHRLQRRWGQLTLPKSKNGGHFFIVTWALRSTFAKQVFPSEQLFICLPPSGEGKQVLDPPNQKTEITSV